MKLLVKIHEWSEYPVTSINQPEENPCEKALLYYLL